MVHFIGSLKNLSKGLLHLDISNTRILGKGVNKVAECLSQSPTIVQSLNSLNLADNPSKGEDIQVSSTGKPVKPLAGSAEDFCVYT